MRGGRCQHCINERREIKHCINERREMSALHEWEEGGVNTA
jgi:hypothetical protein